MYFVNPSCKPLCDSYVCFSFFEIVFKVIDLFFYFTGNSVLCQRSIEPVTKFTMSVR